VKKIPVFDRSIGLFQAGEEIGSIWENYRDVNGNFNKETAEVFQRYGVSCPSTSCGSCEFPECFIGKFIRNYWDCPHGD